MPIYEYRCQRCGAQFEALVMNRGAASEVACKSCQSQEVEKLFSAFAVKAQDAAPAPMAGGCGSCGAPEPGWCQRQRN